MKADNLYQEVYEKTLELGQKKLAEKYVACVDTIYRETNTIWENHAPDKIKPGSTSGPDFCGWGGLGPVAIVREFLR
jgi:hypothetical protein